MMNTVAILIVGFGLLLIYVALRGDGTEDGHNPMVALKTVVTTGTLS